MNRSLKDVLALVALVLLILAAVPLAAVTMLAARSFFIAGVAITAIAVGVSPRLRHRLAP